MKNARQQIPKCKKSIQRAHNHSLGLGNRMPYFQVVVSARSRQVVKRECGCNSFVFLFDVNVKEGHFTGRPNYYILIKEFLF